MVFNFGNWGKGARWALCLVSSATLLCLALRDVDFVQTLQQLERANLYWATIAVGFLFLSFAIRAWRWQYLLLPVKPVSILSLFRSTVIGFMGNYLLPLHGGELVRAISIGQTQKISKLSALGSIVVERFLDGITLSLTPFLLIAVLDLPFWVIQVNLAFLAVYVAGLAIVVLGTVHGWTHVWLRQLVALFPQFVAGRLGAIAEQFFQGMKGLNQIGVFLPVAFLSLLCWFVHGLYYFLLFGALDLNLSIWAALVLQVVLAIGVILPAGPGYVGNFEYFTILGLALFGVAKESAFTYALLAHSSQFVPVTVAGLLLVLRGGLWPQERTEQVQVLTTISS